MLFDLWLTLDENLYNIKYITVKYINLRNIYHVLFYMYRHLMMIPQILFTFLMNLNTLMINPFILKCKNVV